MQDNPSEDKSAPSIIELAESLDGQGMINFTRSFVDDLRKGLSSVNTELMPWLKEIKSTKWHGALFLGMGGSAAGGDFIASLSLKHGSLPIKTIRDYSLPAWWNKSWLVVATSHSGNTEETLSACEAALKAGATTIVISTGGELSGLCELYPKCHLISSIGGQPPRTAFGHIFARQLALMRVIGGLPQPFDGEDEAMLNRLQVAIDGFDILKDPEGDLVQLAMAMVDRPISILGPNELSPALTRFKNQLNENSARFVRVGTVPEMNHNESVAWGGVGNTQDPDAEQHVILLLAWQGIHPRVSHRMDWMVSHFSTDFAWRIDGEGKTLLESLLYLCILMDWISISLALLHGKNPAEIKPIIALKDFLATKTGK
ncbi:MAG: SIS domain-containing protein [Candidatus Poseidoniaceae archaeon]|jgi:glucose/mannose-6-phosphate isomerase